MKADDVQRKVDEALEELHLAAQREDWGAVRLASSAVNHWRNVQHADAMMDTVGSTVLVMMRLGVRLQRIGAGVWSVESIERETPEGCEILGGPDDEWFPFLPEGADEVLDLELTVAIAPHPVDRGRGRGDRPRGDTREVVLQQRLRIGSRRRGRQHGDPQGSVRSTANGSGTEGQASPGCAEHHPAGHRPVVGGVAGP